MSKTKAAPTSDIKSSTDLVIDFDVDGKIPIANVQLDALVS